MRVVLSFALATSLLGACGSDDGGDSGDGASIVVTSNILGDIVTEVVGGATGTSIEVLLPIGADPHEFGASTRQAEAMAEADLLVVNGAGFEAGLDDAVELAGDAGAEVFAFADHAELRSVGGSDDPHLWTDPTALIPAVEALGDALVAAGVDEAVRARAAGYVADLRALDAEVEALLAGIPAEERVLVTNHEVFGYFAARYGFEIVGAVIPSSTTGAEPSAADVDELARVIEDTGVRAIFGETSSPTALAEALADAAGHDVEVVELFTESLGPEGSGAETYLELLRTDARLIAATLT